MQLPRLGVDLNLQMQAHKSLWINVNDIFAPVHFILNKFQLLNSILYNTFVQARYVASGAFMCKFALFLFTTLVSLKCKYEDKLML